MDAVAYNRRANKGPDHELSHLTSPSRTCTLKASHDSRKGLNPLPESLLPEPAMRQRPPRNKGGFRERGLGTEDDSDNCMVEPPPFNDFEMYRLLYTKNIHKDDRPEPTAYTLSTDPLTLSTEKLSLDSHLSINCPHAKERYEKPAMIFVVVKGEVCAMKVVFLHDFQQMLLYRNSQLRVNRYKHFKDCNDTASMLQHCRQTGVISDMLDMSNKHFCMLYWTFTRSPQILLFPDEDAKEDFVVLCQHIIEYTQNDVEEDEVDEDEVMCRLAPQFRERARSFNRLMSDNEFPSAEEDSDNEDMRSLRSSSPSRSLTSARTYKSMGTFSPTFSSAGSRLEYDGLGRAVTRLDTSFYANAERLQQRYQKRRSCATSFDICGVVERELIDRSAVKFFDLTCAQSGPYHCKVIANNRLSDAVVRPFLSKMQLNITDSEGCLSCVRMQWVEKIELHTDIDTLLAEAEGGEDNMGMRVQNVDKNVGAYRYPIKLTLPTKKQMFTLLFNDSDAPMDAAIFILHMQHIYKINRAETDYNVQDRRLKRKIKEKPVHLKIKQRFELD